MMPLSIFKALHCKKWRPHLRNHDERSQQSHSGSAGLGPLANAGLKGQVPVVALTGYARRPSHCWCRVSGEPWAEVGDVSIAGQDTSAPSWAAAAVKRWLRPGSSGVLCCTGTCLFGISGVRSLNYYTRPVTLKFSPALSSYIELYQPLSVTYPCGAQGWRETTTKHNSWVLQNTLLCSLMVIRSLSPRHGPSHLLPGHSTCSPAPENSPYSARTSTLQTLAHLGEFLKLAGALCGHPGGAQGQRPSTPHRPGDVTSAQGLRVLCWGTSEVCCGHCHSPQVLVSFVPSLKFHKLPHLSSRGFPELCWFFFLCANVWLHIYQQLLSPRLPRQKQKLQRLLTSKAFPWRLVSSSKGRAVVLSHLTDMNICWGWSGKKGAHCFHSPPKMLQGGQQAFKYCMLLVIPGLKDKKKNNLTHLVWNKMEAEEIDITKTPRIDCSGGLGKLTG